MTALNTRIDSARSILDANLEALPDPYGISAPNERERFFQQRQQTSAHKNYLDRLTSQIASLDAQRESVMNRPWRDALLSVKAEMLKRQAEIEALPHYERQRLSKECEALAVSLRIIDGGTPGTVGDWEFLPPMLWNALDVRGCRPDPGKQVLFTERGGLLSVENRLQRIDHERAQIVKELEDAIEQTERFLEA